MDEFIDSVKYWLVQESITVTDVMKDGDDYFLSMEDEDGEQISPGDWADADILIQPCEDCHGKEMVRVNSMPIAKIAKLVVAIVVGYPS